MSALQLLTDSAPTVSVLAGAGLLDTLGEKLNDVEAVLRVFAGVAGIGFVVFQAISSRGALSRILISGLAAGVFVWIVFNVTDLKDRVGNEITATDQTQSPALLSGPTDPAAVGAERGSPPLSVA